MERPTFYQDGIFLTSLLLWQVYWILLYHMQGRRVKAHQHFQSCLKLRESSEWWGLQNYWECLRGLKDCKNWSKPSYSHYQHWPGDSQSFVFSCSYFQYWHPFCSTELVGTMLEFSMILKISRIFIRLLKLCLSWLRDKIGIFICISQSMKDMWFARMEYSALIGIICCFGSYTFFSVKRSSCSCLFWSFWTNSRPTTLIKTIHWVFLRFLRTISGPNGLIWPANIIAKRFRQKDFSTSYLSCESLWVWEKINLWSSMNRNSEKTIKLLKKKWKAT